MNAVIMAAGLSSRFVPICWERPKGLLSVKGEVLIERQIRQLKEAGVSDITVVTGYKADMFVYLGEKLGVDIVINPDYMRYNNTSTLMCVLDRLADTWLCSSDNYFAENVFTEHPASSLYAAEYAEGPTEEYCMEVDGEDRITGVTIGGRDAWYMIGHVFLDRDFSKAFKSVLAEEYRKDGTRLQYWEDVYIRHLRELPTMRIRRYPPGVIQEFDSLEDLRKFDTSYVGNTHSRVIRRLCDKLGCREDEIRNIRKHSVPGCKYAFAYDYHGQECVYKSDRL